MSGRLELDVWKGDWGLPTVDVSCLEFLTYLRMCGVEVEVRQTSPLRSPRGSLPVLHTDSGPLTAFPDLVALLNSKNHRPDERLSVKQQGEVKAYTTLLREKLAPALLYIWWVDSKNYTKLTRPWYCRALSFPLNLYYPNKYQKDAEVTIESMFDCFIDSPDMETRLYSDAEKCLTSLSNRLGGSDYMLGSTGCSLDATVYAHLAPLLYTPFPNKTLQNYLANCQNLRTYVHRISHMYYSKHIKEYEDRKREEARKVNEASSEEFPHAKRNKLLGGAVALVSMLLYALSTGLIKGPDSVEGYVDHYDDHEGDGDDS